MNIACIIIGIENWQRFTLPLIESIQKHEPECEIVVIDNESAEPYPWESFGGEPGSRCVIIPTHRMSYSAAINWGKFSFDEWAKIRIPKPQYDWYIVLSNDVLCTGPFKHILDGHDGNDVLGPLMKEVRLGNTTFPYIEGWFVACSSEMWNKVSGWDSQFVGSSWEDVSFSTDARLNGGTLVEETDLPFVHLDQRQRFHIIPDYWSTENANIAYFRNKYKDLIR